MAEGPPSVQQQENQRQGPFGRWGRQIPVREGLPEGPVKPSTKSVPVLRLDSGGWAVETTVGVPRRGIKGGGFGGVGYKPYSQYDDIAMKNDVIFPCKYLQFSGVHYVLSYCECF